MLDYFGVAANVVTRWYRARLHRKLKKKTQRALKSVRTMARMGMTKALLLGGPKATVDEKASSKQSPSPSESPAAKSPSVQPARSSTAFEAENELRQRATSNQLLKDGEVVKNDLTKLRSINTELVRMVEQIYFSSFASKSDDKSA